MHSTEVLPYPRSHIRPQSGDGSPVVHVLEGSGTYVAVETYHAIPQIRRGGGVREHVTYFSRQSRKRMMFACSKICWDSLPPGRLFFITVKTVERGHDSAARLNDGLGRLRKRMERLFGSSGYACFLKKERGWGGRWHAHLVLYVNHTPEALAQDFGVPADGLLPVEFDTRLREWLQCAWQEVTNCGRRAVSKCPEVYCERARDARAVVGYLLKGPGSGSGKAHETMLPQGSEPCGRWWSLWSSQVFPRNPFSMVLSLQESYQVRRLLRRWKEGQSSHRVMLRIWSDLSPMRTVGGHGDGSLYRSLSEYVRRLRQGSLIFGSMNLAAALRQQSCVLDSCCEVAA